MKKRVIFVIVGILITAVLFAEGPLAYRVTATSEAYKQKETSHNIYTTTTITLQKDDIVYTVNGVFYSNLRELDTYAPVMDLAEPNDEYMMYLKNLHPVNTEDVFGEDVFIDYPPDTFLTRVGRRSNDPAQIGDVNEMWVPNYYCYVLNSEDRETLLQFNPGLKELNDFRGGGEVHWYEEFPSDIKNGRCMFYNAAIVIGTDNDTHLLVENIKKTKYGYEVNCVESLKDYGSKYLRPFWDTVFFDKYKPGDEMTLYLYLDGDYMDIYVDGKDIHLGTLVKVNKEFIKEYQSLIKENTCDLSKVQFPRRADGSMDYPIELSNDADVYWVDNKMPESAIGKKAIIQNEDEASPLPLWARIAIIGGSVVIVGGVTLFVLKRKK